MMQNRKMQRMICLLLIFSVLISGSPFVHGVDLSGLFAGSETETVEALKLDDSCKILNYIDAETFQRGKHVGRLKNQEKLDTYVFQNRDGTRTVYYMGGPVKYRDSDGNIREKDLTLVEKSGGYGVVSSNLDMILPGTLGGGIEVTYAGLTITIIPENVSFAVKPGSVDGESYVYADCFGNGIDLAYTPTLDGLKEDIVMERYFGKNQFSFLIETYGLRLFQRDGQYYLAGGENSDDKLWLGDLLIYDAMGKPGTGTMEIATVEEGQIYRVILTADEAFLTDADTVFPVTVDPTVEIRESDTSGAIEDATVYLNKTSLNAANWTYNHVGLYDSNYGVGRTVYRLTGLLADSGYAAATANQVTSVIFHVREASGTPTQTLNLYAMNNSSWTETGVTSGNYGGYDGNTLYASAQLPSNDWGVFDITDLAKEWKNETRNANSGFILVNPNESSTAADKTLYACEHGHSASKPYVVATYESVLSMDVSSLELNTGSSTTISLTSGTAASWTSSNTSVATVSNGVVTGVRAGTATITATSAGGVTTSCTVTVKLPTDTYRISHLSTSYQISTTCSTFGAKNRVTAQSFAASVPDVYAQIWKITYVGNGYYKINPSYNADAYIMMMNETTLGVINTSSNANQWKIYYEGSGYVLKNRLYGTVLYFASGSLSNTDITGSSNTGSYYARWSISPETVPEGMIVYYLETNAYVNPSVYVNLTINNSLKPVCMPLGAHSCNYTVTCAESSLVSFNSETQVITGTTCGQTTITITESTCEKSISFLLQVILPVSGAELAYRPLIWNDPTPNKPYEARTEYEYVLNQIQKWTNCYMYALNIQVDVETGLYSTEAKYPGYYADDHTFLEEDGATKANMITLTLKDGNALAEVLREKDSTSNFSIQSIGRTERCPDGMYKIAVVCTTDKESMHWFRQNPDGSWSQKMGDLIVTDRENCNGYGDTRIWDPETANLGNAASYDISSFCYFAVTSTEAFMCDLPEEEETE